MPKHAKKLIVYLDQNFISEMAKADTNPVVNPQFKRIHELLHQGFIDEKLTVARSFFHEIETSLSPTLKECITKHQGYMGQLDLLDRHTVEIFQVTSAAQRFFDPSSEPHNPKSVYRNDPDERNEQFNIHVDLHLEKFPFYQAERVFTAQQLDAVRALIQKNKVSFTKQFELELDAASKAFADNGWKQHNWLFKTADRAKQFAYSTAYRGLPIVNIHAEMWAKVLGDFSGRPIKSSDSTDVEIISTYLPYVDVLATDSFMANLVRSLKLDVKHQAATFGANKQELDKLEAFLIDYLAKTPPVNQPSLSVFVLADAQIKSDCFEFFRELGNTAAWTESRRGYWIELWGFDDGAMPKYRSKMTTHEIPFSGLQNVHHIKIGSAVTREEVLALCRQNAKAPYFMLIDHHKELPQEFLKIAIENSRTGKMKVLEYDIYAK